MKRSQLGLILIGVCLAWMIYDYFADLEVTSAKVIAVTHDAAKPDLREIQVEIQSDRRESTLVPSSLRRFFWTAPRLCFITADDLELVNEDVQSPCTLETDAAYSRLKSHRQEVSRFAIPVYLRPGPINPGQGFLKSLRRQQGIWLRFELSGYLLPPRIKAAPVFLNVGQFCAENVAQCQGLLSAAAPPS